MFRGFLFTIHIQISAPICVNHLSTFKAPVIPPYKTVKIAKRNSLDLGATYDFSFMNVKTTGEAFVHINVLHNNFPVNPNVMNGTFALPVTPSEIRLHCILTAVYEGCHMFGLVANNNVLGGDADKHNPVPNGTRVMDDARSYLRDPVRAGRPLVVAPIERRILAKARL
ncbi:MAG: hypothetical protein ACOX46_02850 [Limnochordia bacterium]